MDPPLLGCRKASKLKRSLMTTVNGPWQSHGLPLSLILTSILCSGSENPRFSELLPITWIPCAGGRKKQVRCANKYIIQRFFHVDYALSTSFVAVASI